MFSICQFSRFEITKQQIVVLPPGIIRMHSKEKDEIDVEHLTIKFDKIYKNRFCEIFQFINDNKRYIFNDDELNKINSFIHLLCDDKLEEGNEVIEKLNLFFNDFSNCFTKELNLC